MKIITINREFGSGGRELGKRLADELGFAYYDKEILEEIARQSNMDEHFVENVLNKGYTVNFAYHFRTSFAGGLSSMAGCTTDLLKKQTEILQSIAEKGENCVIVGRGAELLLKKYNPFKIFVLADMPSKIARCKAKASADENLTDKDMERKAKEIDKTRAKLHEYGADYRWGEPAGYHLCINTSEVEIKKIVPHIAAYINAAMLSKE